MLLLSIKSFELTILDLDHKLLSQIINVSEK